MANLALAFDILARDRASRTFDKVGDSAERAGKRGSAFGTAMKGGLLIAGGALAGAGVGMVGFLKSANDEARESQKVGALTAQVIKSTGGAAKVTAGQVGDLATAISNKTGIDDEAIQSASNLLLTFTNVRNEVGKGNDIFNQATQAATDMGAAMGKDPKASAIQLGKALNDPIKGVTALSKVGVSFTAQQKSQIKTMVDSGNTLGAQKVILGELNKEFGGAAAASATNGEKLATAFGNFKEQIGTALLPVIDKVAGFLTTKVIPAVSGFIAQMQNGKGAGGQFVSFLKGIWDAVQPIGGFLMGTVVPAVRNFIASFTSGGGPSAIMGLFNGIRNAIATVIPVVVQFVTGTLVPLFQQAVAFIQTRVIPGVMGIVSAVQGFVAVALPIVQAFVAGMMARIGPLMPQIRAIFSTIGTIIVSAMGLIRAVIQRVTAVIGFIWSHWGNQIMNFIGAIFRSILNIVGGALRVIQGVIKVVTSLIKGDWAGAWAGIKQILSGAWQAIKGIVSGALTIVKAVISTAWSAIKAGVGAAWSGIKSAVSAGAGKVVDFVKGLPGRLTSALGDLGGMLYSKGQALIQGLIDGIVSKIKDIGSAMGSVASKIAGFFHGSPIKEGPLKQHGWNENRPGKMLVDSLVSGIDQSRARVAASSRDLAGAVATPGLGVGVSGSAAIAGGGPVVLHFHDHDGVLLGTMRGVAAEQVGGVVTDMKWSRG